MKLLPFTIAGIILVLSCDLIAQSILKGVIEDHQRKPIGGANLLLMNLKDSQMVKGAVSNSDGEFMFEKIGTAKYFITASGIGYKQTNTPPFNIPAGKSEHIVEPIRLMADTIYLDQVTVLSKKPLFEQKIDRMIINVKSSVTSAGTTALDVLERSPGVVVNRQNNSISINNKDGVVVMINGKVTYMPLSAVVQMLGGMPSGNIDRIELITTPPANMDAEGNAGFINIVLISNIGDGTNGSYSISAGYGKGFNNLSSINVNHRSGKWNVYGDYSFTYNRFLQIFRFHRFVNTPASDIETIMKTTRHAGQRNHNLRAGVDYQLSKNTIIGALFGSYDNKWFMDAENENNMVVSNRTDTSLKIFNDEVNQWRHYMANVNLQQKLKGESRIMIDFDYLYYKDQNPVNYLNQYFDESGAKMKETYTNSRKITPINIFVGKADYFVKLNPKTELEAGVKAIFSKFNNDVVVQNLAQNQWVKDPEFSSDHFLKESIKAVFSTINIELSKKTNLKGGLRYEYTNSNLGSDTQANIVDRKYGNVFPSLFVSHKPDEKNSFNFSYSRRITRPTFNDMAPFVIFLDPSTFFSGNPALQPAISNNIKTDYSYKQYLLSVSISKENGSIARFQPKVDEKTNRQVFAAENLISLKSLSASFTIPVILNSWWEIRNNLDFYWYQLNAIYNKNPVQVELKNFRLSTSHTLRFDKAYTAEVFAFYQSAALFGMYVVKPFGTVNVGVQKKLEKGSLRLGVDDIFRTIRFRASVNLPEENLVSSMNLRFIPRIAKLTYMHNFGSDKVNAKRARAGGSEEERSRVQ